MEVRSGGAGRRRPILACCAGFAQCPQPKQQRDEHEVAPLVECPDFWLGDVKTGKGTRQKITFPSGTHRHRKSGRKVGNRQCPCGGNMSECTPAHRLPTRRLCIVEGLVATFEQTPGLGSRHGRLHTEVTAWGTRSGHSKLSTQPTGIDLNLDGPPLKKCQVFVPESQSLAEYFFCVPSPYPGTLFNQGCVPASPISLGVFLHILPKLPSSSSHTHEGCMVQSNNREHGHIS